MKVSDTRIPEVKVIEPRVFADNRGFLTESFNQRRMQEALGRPLHFVQDNSSRSLRHVLRGLHYQLPPFAQGKLVRVVRGKVFDVAVDIRKDSPTFGEWTGIILSEENQRQLWIPEGFAHGFLTLSDSADFFYKVTDYYAPSAERCIIWNDPDLAIDWHGVTHPVLSAKDTDGLSLRAADVF
jgi:dTDP-4-dehydrorhamnose 3,5-epimerase